MQIKATDKAGKQHTGKDIKHLLVTDEDEMPIAVIKETRIHDLTNFKILTPADKDFAALIRSLGFAVDIIN